MGWTSNAEGYKNVGKAEKQKHQVLTEKDIEEILTNNESDFFSEDDDTDSEISAISTDSDRDTESGTSGAKSDIDNEIDGSENIRNGTRDVSNDTENVTIEIVAETLTWDDISGVSDIEYLRSKLPTKLFCILEVSYLLNYSYSWFLSVNLVWLLWTNGWNYSAKI